ncbi:class I SAM-dependent methyltransferase [Mangrovibrevibacter kandeliae]|uniref:class I SAM-dependent methyltransferase n=1 Tax=Mangrovibrevibacter kandeliae TaxID=2968473 RepID=UPI0021194CF3|nr:class I SAM-dependent methyltransferase [Aurantimonas sp. CSK15Z-1]MCQ8783195.1 class I SAM-dependent methyltransferase [Aurantimonas sp. CSK15Z-1]
MGDANPTNTLHSAARDGFAARAATYAKARPDYPAAVEAWLRDSMGLGPGSVAIDLGAGTGKFLPRLLATGASVTAVEPVAAMRSELSSRHPGVTALDGTAEAIPLPEASADAILCATAFHWFATPAALGEMRRVLKPGGRLGLVWNIRDDTPAWAQAIAAIVERHAGDAPRRRDDAWRALFPGHGFGPLADTRLVHSQVAPSSVIVDRALSISFIAALPDDTQSEVAEEIRMAVAHAPELAGDLVTLRYETLCCRADRLD